MSGSAPAAEYAAYAEHHGICEKHRRQAKCAADGTKKKRHCEMSQVIERHAQPQHFARTPFRRARINQHQRQRLAATHAKPQQKSSNHQQQLALDKRKQQISGRRDEYRSGQDAFFAIPGNNAGHHHAHALDL